MTWTVAPGGPSCTSCGSRRWPGVPDIASSLDELVNLCAPCSSPDAFKRDARGGVTNRGDPCAAPREGTQAAGESLCSSFLLASLGPSLITPFP